MNRSTTARLGTTDPYPRARAWHRRALPLAVLLSLLVGSDGARGEIEIGVGAGAHLFNHQKELGRYQGDPPENALMHSAVFGLRTAWLPVPRLSIEGELVLIPTQTYDMKASVLVMSLRGQVLLNLLTGRVRPFVLVGVGGDFSSSSNPAWITRDTDMEMHGGAGLSVDLGKDWGLRADGRILISPGVLGANSVVPEWEFTAGAYGRFPWHSEGESSADSDKDGVTDSKDECPEEAGKMENDGCPEGKSSRDGGASADGGGVGGSTAADGGGPDGGADDSGGAPPAQSDRDGDGVTDRYDACPDVAGPIDSGGCPIPHGELLRPAAPPSGPRRDARSEAA